MIRLYQHFTAVIVFTLFYFPLKAQELSLSQKIEQLVDSADAHRAAGALERSIAKLRRGEKMARNASDSLKAIISHKLAVHFFYTDSFPQAISAVTKAVELRTQALPFGHIDIANSLYLRSLIFRYAGKSSAGIADLEAAVRHIESNSRITKIESASRLASYYAEWGVLLATQGDYYQALFCWDQAERYERQHASSSYLKTRLAYLSELRGTIFHDIGQYDDAIEAFEYALEWQERQQPPSPMALASLYNNLGLTYQQERQYKKALTLFEKAFGLFDKQKERSGMLSVYPNLLKAQAQNDQPEKAKATLAAGLSLVSEVYGTPYHPTAAKMHYYLAEAWLEKEERQESLPNHLQQALHLLAPSCSGENWQDIPDVKGGIIANQTDLLSPMFLKAHFLFTQAQDSSSPDRIEKLEQALRVFESLDLLISQSRQNFKVASSKFYFQKLWIKAYEEAALVSLELYNATTNPAFLNKAFQMASKNKAVVLLEGIKNLDAKKLARIPDSLLTWERELLSDYYQLEDEVYKAIVKEKEEQVKDKKNKLLDTRIAYDRLIRKLENEYPRYYELKYQPVKSVDPAALQKKLDDKTLLIEYFIGSDNILVFFLSSNVLEVMVMEKPAELEADCISYRKLSSKFGLSPEEQDTFMLLSQKLYTLLLQKGLEQFGNSYEHLLLVPDGILLGLSFEALKTGPTSQDYLLYRYQVSYVYANYLLSQPIEQQRITWAQKKRFLGFGLEYDGRLLDSFKQLDTTGNQRSLSLKLRKIGELIYSDDEVLEVNELLKGQAFVNAEATKSNFLKNSQKGDILHLAMHGLLDLDDPLRSALVFAPQKDQSEDYLLYAREIYNLDLPDNRMVVLSACNTGYGKVYIGEGIRSLSRAFMHAGAHSVVASLWSAPDQSTKEITVNFYKNLKMGMSKSAAFQKAKVDFLEQASPTYQSPAYWAHLVIIGQNTPLFGNRSNHWLRIIGVAVLAIGFFFFWANRKQMPKINL